MTRSKDHRRERNDKQSQQQARLDTRRVSVPPQPPHRYYRALEVQQGREIPLEHPDRPKHYGSPGGERDRIHASYKYASGKFVEAMQRLKEIDKKSMVDYTTTSLKILKEARHWAEREIKGRENFLSKFYEEGTGAGVKEQIQLRKNKLAEINLWISSYEQAEQLARASDPPARQPQPEPGLRMITPPPFAYQSDRLSWTDEEVNRGGGRERGQPSHPQDWIEQDIEPVIVGRDVSLSLDTKWWV